MIHTCKISAVLFALMLPLSTAWSATIDANNGGAGWLLDPDLAGQPISISVSPHSGDKEMSGLDLFLTITHVSGSTVLPTFSSIDLDGPGMIFPAGSEFSPSGLGTTAVQSFAAFGLNPISAPADGMLAALEIDTTGNTEGGTYLLGFGAFADLVNSEGASFAPLNLIDGTITVAAIPEPAVLIQLLGLAVAMGLFVSFRKRRCRQLAC